MFPVLMIRHNENVMMGSFTDKNPILKRYANWKINLLTFLICIVISFIHILNLIKRGRDLSLLTTWEYNRNVQTISLEVDEREVFSGSFVSLFYFFLQNYYTIKTQRRHTPTDIILKEVLEIPKCIIDRLSFVFNFFIFISTSLFGNIT